MTVSRIVGTLCRGKSDGQTGRRGSCCIIPTAYCDTPGGYSIPYVISPTVQDLTTVRDNKLPTH